MTGEILSAERAKGVRRLLLVDLVFAGVLVLLALPLLLGSYQVYGGIVLAVAVVLGVVGYLALRALQEQLPGARRLAIVTGVLLVVLSVPLMPIWIGLLTVIAGIGLLVIVFAPEREEE